MIYIKKPKRREVPRLDAMRVANQVIELISPVCYEAHIGGSLRRGHHWVGDVEIIAGPVIRQYEKKPLQPSLFTDDDKYRVQLVDEMEIVLEREGLIENTKKELGRQYKLSIDGIQVDLFSVIYPAQMGVILAHRTGPWNFTRHCVTSQRDGGAMPLDMNQSGGVLWRHGKPLTTPTERSYFRQLGLPCLKPDRRTVRNLHKNNSRKKLPVTSRRTDHRQLPIILTPQRMESQSC